MKCVALLIAIVSAVTSTRAAECTSEQIAAADEKASSLHVETVCASAASLMAKASNPLETAKEICVDKKCMSAIASLLKIQHDCTIQGTGLNYKTKNSSQYANYLNTCQRLGLLDVGSSPTASVPASAVASSTPTVTVATSAVAVAVLAACVPQ